MSIYTQASIVQRRDFNTRRWYDAPSSVPFADRAEAERAVESMMDLHWTRADFRIITRRVLKTEVAKGVYENAASTRMRRQPPRWNDE